MTAVAPLETFPYAPMRVGICTTSSSGVTSSAVQTDGLEFCRKLELPGSASNPKTASQRAGWRQWHPKLEGRRCRQMDRPLQLWTASNPTQPADRRLLPVALQAHYYRPARRLACRARQKAPRPHPRPLRLRLAPLQASLWAALPSWSSYLAFCCGGIGRCSVSAQQQLHKLFIPPPPRRHYLARATTSL
jgi:hypothetical protein